LECTSAEHRHALRMKTPGARGSASHANIGMRETICLPCGALIREHVPCSTPHMHKGYPKVGV